MKDNLITSPANENVKAVRKLKDRKYRDASQRAYVEGTRQVIEAIHQNAEVEKLVVTSDYLESTYDSAVGEAISNCAAPKLVVTEDVFRSFSLKDGHSGVAAIVKQNWKHLDEVDENFSGIWVCLWEIADPGNLGTIIRTMDGTGVKGLILVGNTTDPYDPAAIRASMGGVFNTILVKSSLEELINVIKVQSILAIGTSDAAGKYYRDVRYPSDMFLIMGSERQGIPTLLSNLCNAMVSLPMLGVCDSLNLAVATGVMLYEILDQRMKNTGYGKR